MRYVDALRFLYGLESKRVKLGLTRIEEALARRGHPERALRVVHVAGTNGKGSVSATLESCLRAAGYRTGLFTSPHLHRFSERIQVEGRPECEEELARRIQNLQTSMEDPRFPAISFFEAATILAFEAFKERQCDVVVLEVGLGGRLDATNVVRPRVAVITRIALDHERILGGTIEAVAAEKAGVIKPGVPLVTSVRSPEAREVIADHARRADAAPWWVDTDFSAAPGSRPGTVDIQVGRRRIRSLKPSLVGAHQVDNLACAVAALVRLDECGIRVGEEALRQGVESVRWPGRLERIAGSPDVIVDAAHNIDACAALGSFLAPRRPRGPRVLVFGTVADKDYAGMLAELDGQFEHYIFVTPKVSRAAPAEALAEVRAGSVAASVSHAVDTARRLAGEAGLVVVAGSIFLVAEARAYVLGIDNDPAIRG